MGEEDHENAGDEVAMLRQEVSQLTQEVLMHRKVLEQCLEMRESVLELLEHREALVQCLELREAVQAILASTQVIGEVADRTAELDLSLAGVSDNTARHGKAISNLTEQQKRTTATLDAVVRAVKRLDRSRSRSRGTASTVPTLPGTTAFVHTPMTEGGLQTVDGAVETADGWSEPNHPAEADGYIQGNTHEYEADDPWAWPGWDDERLGVSNGHASDGRNWRVRPRVTEPRISNRPRSGPAGGQGRPGTWQEADPQQYFDYDHEPGTNGLAPLPPGTSTAMADCVKGVLARINEALTKLDGPAKDSKAERDSITARESLDTRVDPSGASGSDRNVRSGRPGSAAASGRAAPSTTPRGKTPTTATPRAYGGTTPSCLRNGGPVGPRDDGQWRLADSWA